MAGDGVGGDGLLSLCQPADAGSLLPFFALQLSLTDAVAGGAAVFDPTGEFVYLCCAGAAPARLSLPFIDRCAAVPCHLHCLPLTSSPPFALPSGIDDYDQAVISPTAERSNGAGHTLRQLDLRRPVSRQRRGRFTVLSLSFLWPFSGLSLPFHDAGCVHFLVRKDEAAIAEMSLRSLHFGSLMNIALPFLCIGTTGPGRGYDRCRAVGDPGFRGRGEKRPAIRYESGDSIPS